MLQLAGELADGVVLMGKGDLGEALGIVNRGRNARSPGFVRAYLDRLVFNPEMLSEAKHLYSYALMDSPDRMLRNIGLDAAQISKLSDAMQSGGSAAVTDLVTDEMVEGYQVVGTPDECGRTLGKLADDHALDIFMINIISPGLGDNVALLEEVSVMVGSGGVGR